MKTIHKGKGVLRTVVHVCEKCRNADKSSTEVKGYIPYSEPCSKCGKSAFVGEETPEFKELPITFTYYRPTIIELRKILHLDNIVKHVVNGGLLRKQI